MLLLPCGTTGTSYRLHVKGLRLHCHRSVRLSRRKPRLRSRGSNQRRSPPAHQIASTFDGAHRLGCRWKPCQDSSTKQAQRNLSDSGTPQLPNSCTAWIAPRRGRAICIKSQENVQKPRLAIEKTSSSEPEEITAVYLPRINRPRTVLVQAFLRAAVVRSKLRLI